MQTLNAVATLTLHVLLEVKVNIHFEALISTLSEVPFQKSYEIAYSLGDMQLLWFSKRRAARVFVLSVHYEST